MEQQGKPQAVKPTEMLWHEATRAYKWYRVTEHRRELEVFEASVVINETTYQQKSNHGGQCYKNYNNENNPQGTESNNYKGKTTHNNGPKVQCKFCFGPKEIFQICKLLEEHANKPWLIHRGEGWWRTLLNSSRIGWATLQISMKLN